MTVMVISDPGPQNNVSVGFQNILIYLGSLKIRIFDQFSSNLVQVFLPAIADSLHI